MEKAVPDARNLDPYCLGDDICDAMYARIEMLDGMVTVNCLVEECEIGGVKLDVNTYRYPPDTTRCHVRG